MDNPRFLSVERVLQAHNLSIERTGGSPGVRDAGLLESAVMMPQQEFGGQFLHEGLAAKAAAYLYHIAANHPFIDGNKRTAALAALTFLDLNGTAKLPAPAELEAVTWRIADGSMMKDELVEWFKGQVGER